MTDQQPECPEGMEACRICGGTGLVGSGQVWDDGFDTCSACRDGWITKKRPIPKQPDIPVEYRKNQEQHLTEIAEIALQVSDARDEKIAFDPKFYEEVGRRLWFYLVDESII